MRAICCLAAILSVSAAGSFPVHAAPEPPSLPEITARLRQMPPHPRLFGGRGAESLRENAGTPMGKILAERILYDADEMLRVQPERRRMAGRSILMSSRRILYRVNTLSVAYLLSGEKKYAERAIREMLSAANFSDWNPGHFLDTAELTMALSIGYDFLYRELTPEQRSLIREAIVQKGLRPSLSGDRESCFWIDGVGNWVQVCHAGMVAGALVTFDPASGLSAELIQRAIRNMPKMVRHGYFPRGAYPEGPGYWNYGTQFHGAMIAMLESALGTDFGLLRCPASTEPASSSPPSPPPPAVSSTIPTVPTIWAWSSGGSGGAAATTAPTVLPRSCADSSRRTPHSARRISPGSSVRPSA